MFGARRAEAGIYVWKRAVARLGRTWEDCQAGFKLVGDVTRSALEKPLCLQYGERIEECKHEEVQRTHL